MSLEVLEANGLVTIQDIGRGGWQRFGVPLSGPMDAFAMRTANVLVGNPQEEAVLEIGTADATFRALHDCVIAVTGAGFGVSVYIWEFTLWNSILVRGGWKIRLTKKDGGTWAYLAIAGGVQTQPVLGSRSTYLRGGFGGLHGKPLQAGGIIPTNRSSRSLQDLAARTLPEEFRPSYIETSTLDVILGPQTDCFTDKGIQTFLSNEYTISFSSDRMGYRLEGPSISHRGSADLLSEGMARGSAQVPANGQPIVMQADCPTTGGYPKIASVISADQPVLAQVPIGSGRIRFRETSIEEAQTRYRNLMNGLQSGITRSDEKDVWS